MVSVFGVSPPPGTYTLYTDGSPGLTLGQDFGTYGGLLNGSQCTGGRVYVPAVEAPHTSTIDIMLWSGGTMADAPVRTKTVPVPGVGWVEATWDTPFPMPADGSRVRVGYRFSGTVFGPTRYIHTPGLRAGSGAIQSAGLELSAAPSTYLMFDGQSQSTSQANVGYGIDILVEPGSSGPPPNSPPVARAGADQNVGSQVVVTISGATSTDSDGTVASYAWAQTGGPAVILNGTGHTRTFVSPDGPTSLSFRLTVTDDDGDSSQDTVVINVAAPEPEIPDTPSAVGGINLPLNRMLTKQFIAAKPDVLTLIPHSKQKLPAGGWEWQAGAPRSPQTMTLIEHTGPPVMVRAQDGVERKVEFELLGEWDAAMAVGDEFTYKGRQWALEELWVDNGYEKRARVTARG